MSETRKPSSKDAQNNSVLSEQADVILQHIALIAPFSSQNIAWALGKQRNDCIRTRQSLVVKVAHLQKLLEITRNSTTSAEEKLKQLQKEIDAANIAIKETDRKMKDLVSNSHKKWYQESFRYDHEIKEKRSKEDTKSYSLYQKLKKRADLCNIPSFLIEILTVYNMVQNLQRGVCQHLAMAAQFYSYLVYI